MGLLTVNGFDFIEGRMFVPRIGRWSLEGKIDSDTEITGPVTVAVGDGSLTLQGAVDRGGEFVALASAIIVAGAGGLDTVAKPKHYNSMQAGTIASDLLKNAGEVLSGTSDPTLLATDLDAWTTAALPVGRLFRRLLAVLGADVAWRVLPDGSFWVGRETWPDSGLTADDVDVLEQDDEQGFALLGLKVPVMLAGTSLLGRNVSYVEYAFTDVMRAKVWYEDANATSDRFDAAIRDAVLSSIPDVDYGALYTGRVISQDGGTVDVAPDDQRLPSMGSVPLNVGLPGASVDGTAGGRVLIGWAARDPSKPYAVSFDTNNTVQTMLLAVIGMLTLGSNVAAEPFLKAITTNAAWAALATAFATYLAGIQTIADPGPPGGKFTPALLTALTTFTTALEGAGTLLVEGA